MKICKKTLSLQPEISIIQCFMKKHYRIFEKLYNMLIFRHLELYISDFQCFTESLRLSDVT